MSFSLLDILQPQTNYAGPRRGLLLTGPNASGKTTAAQAALAGLPHDSYTAIYADNSNRAAFKGGMPDIEALLRAWWLRPVPLVLVEGTNRIALCLLRVVESTKARSLDVVYTRTAPEVMGANLAGRCHKLSKRFRADYWDVSRLTYEGSGRYDNLCPRFAPYADSVTAFDIGPAYAGSDALTAFLRARVTEAVEAAR